MHDRLGALDASLLALESPSTLLHTGGVSIFGPGLDSTSVHDRLRERLPRVPRARQLLRPTPLGGKPVWIDAPAFDLSYHLRHAALPSPGTLEQLGDYVSRLIGRQLDRSYPLWELYVIKGLEGGRTALFGKIHLVMAAEQEQEGDPFAALLDEAPDAEEASAPRIDSEPEPPPSPLELTVDAVRERTVAAVRLGARAGGAVRRPAQARAAASAVATSALGLVARAARTAPPSPLNRPLTRHRRFAFAYAELAQLRDVRSAYGGTINDAVVAVVGDAVGRLLRNRGYDTKDLDLRVMVPVRVEEAGTGEPLPGAHTLREGAVGVLAPLPVMEMDPVARLYRVMGELAHLRDSGQAVAADRLAKVAGFGPPGLHAIAARLAIGEQRYNLALSNAPGPQSPRWLAGVPLEASHPFIPLAGDAGLSVAVSSYAGSLCFGLLGDRRAVPDVEDLAGHLHDAVVDLVAACGARTRDGVHPPCPRAADGPEDEGGPDESG
ncbi:wax ester/triacylglycerol synthase family O-acyltransferase [Egibacter rhizosphaerae]|nr:wax ester/triacylglycerol synthase family O-acyltransferase [Egibacter rhizosphaerae]